jgi:hypothetical protein
MFSLLSKQIHYLYARERSGLLTRMVTESRFVVHADDKLSALVELERQVLTVTFYLESNHADPCR